MGRLERGAELSVGKPAYGSTGAREGGVGGEKTTPGEDTEGWDVMLAGDKQRRQTGSNEKRGIRSAGNQWRDTSTYLRSGTIRGDKCCETSLADGRGKKKRRRDYKAD